MSTETPWSGDLLRIDWADVKDTGDLKGTLKQALADWLPSSASPSSWLVSSVQRSMESHLREIVSETASAYRLVNYRDLGLTVEVDEPDKVGIDRLLAVTAAAVHIPDQPLIVIQAGSAITIDWFEPPACFVGRHYAWRAHDVALAFDRGRLVTPSGSERTAPTATTSRSQHGGCNECWSL